MIKTIFWVLFCLNNITFNINISEIWCEYSDNKVVNLYQVFIQKYVEYCVIKERKTNEILIKIEYNDVKISSKTKPN